MLILFIYDFIILMPIISIILLIPGRVQGYYYRKHFKGRKLLNKKDYMQSIKYSKEFIEDIRLNNWKKKLILLSWGIYSKDIEAMTLNNLGVAYLELGDLKVANEYFNETIEIDSLYCLPYFNLSILENVKGDIEMSKMFYKKSVELGFKQTKFDNVVQKSQQILAEIEG